MSASHVIAVDLGGTNVRLGLVRKDGKILRRRRTTITDTESGTSLNRALSEKIAAFADASRDLPKPAGVGLGFAGPTNSETGRIYYAPNIGGLVGLNIVRDLEKSLGMRVMVANDANCAALGEYWKGAGEGACSLFVFTLGTGVGGGLVIDGEIWEGASGIAGEVGHTIIDIDGPRCECGRRGCLEALASGTAVVREYVRRSGIKSAAARRAVTAKAVFDKAKGGDRVAGKVVAGAAMALGIGIANVFNLINPELILIGGGVSRAGGILTRPAVKHARELVFPPLRTRLKVRRTRLGDDAGILGAARVVFTRGGW
jgi:glucokinase